MFFFHKQIYIFWWFHYILKILKGWKWDFLLSNNGKIRANEDKDSAENIPQVRDDEGSYVEEIYEGQDEHNMGNVFFCCYFNIKYICAKIVQTIIVYEV